MFLIEIARHEKINNNYNINSFSPVKYAVTLFRLVRVARDNS